MGQTDGEKNQDVFQESGGGGAWRGQSFFSLCPSRSVHCQDVGVSPCPSYVPWVSQHLSLEVPKCLHTECRLS